MARPCRRVFKRRAAADDGTKMALISRSSLVYYLLAVCYVCTTAKDPEMQRAIKTCSKRLKVNPDQIIAAIIARSPKQNGEKYVLQCMVDALGMMSPDGKVNPEKVHAFTDRKRVFAADRATPETPESLSRPVNSALRPSNIPSRVLEPPPPPMPLPHPTYYDEFEDVEEGYFEPDPSSFQPRKVLHSKPSGKERVRRQLGPQQPQGNFQNPGQNFNPNQQTFPNPNNPNQQNFPNQQYPNPNNQNQQYPNSNNQNQQYPNSNNPNPLLSPLERALSTVRGLLASDSANPNGQYNPNNQSPFSQNGPYNPNSQTPYNQNGPFNQNGQPPYVQNGPSPPFNQRSKRSPQELVLTSTEIVIPPEAAAVISDRLRRLFLALISQDGLNSTVTDNINDDAELIEPSQGPRKRREDSSGKPEPPLEQQVLSMLRDRANNGVLHQIVKYLREGGNHLPDTAERMVNQTGTPPRSPPR